MARTPLNQKKHSPTTTRVVVGAVTEHEVRGCRALVTVRLERGCRMSPEPGTIPNDSIVRIVPQPGCEPADVERAEMLLEKVALRVLKLPLAAIGLEPEEQPDDQDVQAQPAEELSVREVLLRSLDEVLERSGADEQEAAATRLALEVLQEGKGA